MGRERRSFAFVTQLLWAHSCDGTSSCLAASCTYLVFFCVALAYTDSLRVVFIYFASFCIIALVKAQRHQANGLQFARLLALAHLHFHCCVSRFMLCLYSQCAGQIKA